MSYFNKSSIKKDDISYEQCISTHAIKKNSIVVTDGTEVRETYYTGSYFPKLSTYGTLT